MSNCLKYLVLIMAVLSFSSPAYASPCDDSALPFQAYSAEELRLIARNCQSETKSLLYYNRAYHIELLDNVSYLKGLSYRSNQTIAQDIDTYKMFIALSEMMAESITNPELRAKELNHLYFVAQEEAELRFKGFTRLADRYRKEHIHSFYE